MASPWALLKQALQLFISNFVYFLKFWLVQVGLSIAAVIVIVIPMTINGAIINISRVSVWSVGFLVIGVTVAIALFTWLTAAMYSQAKTVVESNPKPIKELLGLGWQIAAKLFVTMLIYSLLVGLGFLLLIIPGVILMVWFWLTMPVLLWEGKSGWSALTRSRQIVQGKFWRVLGYVLFPILIIIILQSIIGLVTDSLVVNVVSSIASIPLSFIMSLYVFLAYKAFVSTKA